MPAPTALLRRPEELAEAQSIPLPEGNMTRKHSKEMGI